MEWKDVLKKITDAAPSAGAFFGAPGVAVGTAIKALASAFGLSEDASAESVVSAITVDPEAKLKLITAQNNYNLELVKMSLADVQSARQMNIETTKSTGKRDTNLYILAWVIMGGFLGLMLAMIVAQYGYGRVLANDPLLTLLLGSLATDAGMVVGYFFGSSKSSADKNEFLSKK